MTEAAKTTTTKKPTTKKPTTAKAQTAPKPAPKVEANDRPAPAQTSNLMENLFLSALTVVFFVPFAILLFYTLG